MKKEKQKQEKKQFSGRVFFADVSMSYGELAFWQGYFTKLAKRCGLVKEFRENAII